MAPVPIVNVIGRKISMANAQARAAVICVGLIGKQHAADTGDPRSALTLICDMHGERARTAAHRPFPGKPVVGQFEIGREGERRYGDS